MSKNVAYGNPNDIDMFSNETVLPFKVSNDMQLFEHVFSEYTEEEIRESHDLLTSTINDSFGKNVEVGKIIHAKFADSTETEYLFDIGYKDYLRVEVKKEETFALAQYTDSSNNLMYGTDVKVQVTEVTESPYLIKGSLSIIQRQIVIDEILEEENTIVEGVVREFIPAGFIVDVEYKNETIKSFMPKSLAGANKLTVEQSEQLVGQRINALVLSYSSEKDTFIIDRNGYYETMIPDAIDEIDIYDENGENILYEGTVTGKKKFGVYVQFNEFITGMVHKSNLSDENFKNMNNINDGDKINVYIKDIITRKDGVKLVNLTEILEETLLDTANVGDIIDGIVDESRQFGLLIQLDNKTKGSVYTDELTKSGKSFEVGDNIKTKIIEIDKKSRKINLEIV